MFRIGGNFFSIRIKIFFGFKIEDFVHVGSLVKQRRNFYFN